MAGILRKPLYIFVDILINVGEKCKSLNQLYSLYTHKCSTIRDKIFVQLFIDRLSGPDIGFYCLDLFPMNNYEFTEYVMNFFVIYVLFSQTFRIFIKI